MPRDVSATLLPHFFKKYTKVSTGFVFSIDDVDDYMYTDFFPLPSFSNGGYEGLAIKRSSIRSDDGTVLNELEVGLDNTSLDFKAMVMAGKFNNKKCKINLVFWKQTILGAEWTFLGNFQIYSGYTDAPKGDENWITLTIAPFPIFERSFPRRVFQIGCNWSFCDAECGLNLTTYKVDTLVSSLSDGVTINCSHAKAVNYFTPGYIKITSGTYSGEVRPILSNDASSVTARISFGHTIAQNTTITLQKLCAKNPLTCQNDYSNFPKYGGFPTVPKQPII